MRIISILWILLLHILPAHAATVSLKQLSTGITANANAVITVTNANYYVYKAIGAPATMKLVIGIGEPKSGGSNDGRRICIDAANSAGYTSSPANNQSFNLTAPPYNGTYDIWLGWGSVLPCSDPYWFSDVTSPWEQNGSYVDRTEKAKLGTITVINGTSPPVPPGGTCDWSGTDCPSNPHCGAYWPSKTPGEYALITDEILNKMDGAAFGDDAVCLPDYAGIMEGQTNRTCRSSSATDPGWEILPQKPCHPGAMVFTGSVSQLVIWEYD